MLAIVKQFFGRFRVKPGEPHNVVTFGTMKGRYLVPVSKMSTFFEILSQFQDPNMCIVPQPQRKNGIIFIDLDFRFKEECEVTVKTYLQPGSGTERARLFVHG